MEGGDLQEMILQMGGVLFQRPEASHTSTEGPCRLRKMKEISRL